MSRRGRSRTYPKDGDDKLRESNRELKAENRLRSLVERSDIRRLDHLEQLANKQKNEEVKEHARRDWTCFECGKGHMKIVILPRRDGVFYFRSCTLCENRTRSKKYTEEVEES